MQNQEQQEHKIFLPTAAYARLSVENSGHETDETLQTQVTLVHEYIRNHPDLQLVDTYIDNGFSGMDFDRPEFERLMQDVRSGRIQCIVVRDLSRFGRDYLETGHYLETIFPRLNVRFIAVTDNFDSNSKEDMESLAVPIKNMVNGLYAKDISKKLVAINEMKRQKGEALAGFPPFGFLRSEDGTAYVIDENTAPYIRVLYQWFLLGNSKPEIIERLDLLNAPCPKERKRVNSKSNDGQWYTSSISRYLQNPAYVGDLALGKTKSAKYKGMGITPVDKENWVIHKNRHEPIILRDDFQAVQEIFNQNKRIHSESWAKSEEQRSEAKNHFSGMVYCGCCRKRMTFERRSRAKETKLQCLFVCKTRKGTSPCSYHNMQQDLLMILVMDQIRNLIQAMCDRKHLIEILMEPNSEKSISVSIQKKIGSLSYRIAQTEERKVTLYEDFAEGLLEEDEYQYMKEHYILEKQKLENELQEVMQKQHGIEKKAQVFMEQVNHLEQYLDCREFNEELVKELVSTIYVGMDNTIEIKFKCKDYFRELMEYMKGITDEE